MFIVAHFDVHLVHLGVVMLVDLPDDLDVESAEDQLISMPPMTREQLLSSALPLEYWTRALLKSL